MDALSRMPINNSDVIEGEITREILAGNYGIDKLGKERFTLTHQKIDNINRNTENW